MEPEIRAEDETLQTLLEQYNRYGTITVTYTFGDKKEVLDGETDRSMAVMRKVMK